MKWLGELTKYKNFRFHFFHLQTKKSFRFYSFILLKVFISNHFLHTIPLWFDLMTEEDFSLRYFFRINSVDIPLARHLFNRHAGHNFLVRIVISQCPSYRHGRIFYRKQTMTYWKLKEITTYFHTRTMTMKKCLTWITRKCTIINNTGFSMTY